MLDRAQAINQVNHFLSQAAPIIKSLLSNFKVKANGELYKPQHTLLTKTLDEIAGGSPLEWSYRFDYKGDFVLFVRHKGQHQVRRDFYFERSKGTLVDYNGNPLDFPPVLTESDLTAMVEEGRNLEKQKQVIIDRLAELKYQLFL